MSGYNKNSKNVLKQHTIAKNSVIAQKIEDGHTLEETFINDKLQSAVIKVSPEIKKLLMMNKRIHIDMVSDSLRPYFHVMQCFSCKQFGHLAKNYTKNEKEEDTYLYHSSKHSATYCKVKQDTKSHKCSNCKDHEDNKHTLVSRE